MFNVAENKQKIEPLVSVKVGQHLRVDRHQQIIIINKVFASSPAENISFASELLRAAKTPRFHIQQHC